VVDERVVDHQRAARGRRRVQEFPGIDIARGQRLLDKDVLSRFEGGKGHGVVGRNGGREGHRHDARIPEDVRKAFRQAHPWVFRLCALQARRLLLADHDALKAPCCRKFRASLGPQYP